MIEAKVWGLTKPLIEEPYYSVHHLSVFPHSDCSEHRHEHKRNWFYLISGRVWLSLYATDSDPEIEFELPPLEMIRVKPGRYHRFFTKGEPAVLLEGYDLAPLGEDIIRRNQGSRAKPAK